jgi:hypothetical protein
LIEYVQLIIMLIEYVQSENISGEKSTSLEN